MKQVTENMTDIQLDNEELVDRIFYSGTVALSNEFAQQLYKSESYEVKDLLMEIDYAIKQGVKSEVLEQMFSDLEELI